MKTELVVAGVIVLIIGVILSAVMYGNVQACQGVTKQVVGFFNPETKAQCGTFGFLLILGYVFSGLGALLLILGLFLKKE